MEKNFLLLKDVRTFMPAIEIPIELNYAGSYASSAFMAKGAPEFGGKTVDIKFTIADSDAQNQQLIDDNYYYKYNLELSLIIAKVDFASYPFNASAVIVNVSSSENISNVSAF